MQERRPEKRFVGLAVPDLRYGRCAAGGVFAALPRAGAGDDEDLPAQRIAAFGQAVEEAGVVGGRVGCGIVSAVVARVRACDRRSTGCADTTICVAVERLLSHRPNVSTSTRVSTLLKAIRRLPQLWQHHGAADTAEYVAALESVGTPRIPVTSR